MCVANGRRSGTRSVACASILAPNGRRSGKLESFLRDLVLKKLDLEDYLGLRAGGTTIERDLHGEKVVRLPDGSMLKLFRRKHLLSSALLYPYAQRFSDNCARLAGLGIACPSVIAVFRVQGLKRDVVHYRPLPGQTIRQLIQAGLDPAAADQLRVRLGGFVAQLHQRGVYFRSLHLGNIVQTPDGGLGLIDVADLNARRLRLGDHARQRNMRHLRRYRDDHAWLMASPHFEEAYLAALQTKPPVWCSDETD